MAMKNNMKSQVPKSKRKGNQKVNHTSILGFAGADYY